MNKNNYDKKAIGQRIQQIRFDKGMTTKQFGALFGASDSNVSSWEKGRNKPNKQRLKMIADIGDITLDELLYGKSQTRELINNIEQLALKNIFESDDWRKVYDLMQEVKHELI